MALGNRQAQRREAMIADAIREVGVLFVTFAPLDLAFQGSPNPPVAAALIFFLAGVLLFGVGLRMGARND
jgi:hypothetical protein